MTKNPRRTAALAALVAAPALVALGLGLAGCGKYGKPSRAKPETAEGAQAGATSGTTPAAASGTTPGSAGSVPAGPQYKDPSDPRLEGNRP